MSKLQLAYLEDFQNQILEEVHPIYAFSKAKEVDQSKIVFAHANVDASDVGIANEDLLVQALFYAKSEFIAYQILTVLSKSNKAETRNTVQKVATTIFNNSSNKNVKARMSTFLKA